jgi:hypothetical protein
MKVLLIGLKYFTNKLARELNDYNSENKYLSFDTYYSKTELLKFFSHLPSADLIYSINGSTSKSRVFDIVLKMKKPLFIQWAGTDVLSALQNKQTDNLFLGYADYASNFCEAPWLIEELQSVGIIAKDQLFSCITSPKSNSSFTDRFTVFTYVGNNREDFYGLNTFLNLAKLLPEIKFVTVGAEIKTSLSNVNCLGWVKDMSNVIRDSHVHIRWTFHDSLANTVLETISEGRYVIWKNKYPGTIDCNNEKDLFEILISLYSEFKSGKLLLNTHGRDLIFEQFNKNRVLGELIKSFNNK